MVYAKRVFSVLFASVLVLIAREAWSQANLGLPLVAAEQVGVSNQKLDRIHDVVKQEVEQGKLPGTVVLVARRGKLVYADVVGFGTRTRVSRWASTQYSGLRR
jgi:hypothetical protein